MHFRRVEGDIDATLGNAAVLRASSNTAEDNLEHAEYTADLEFRMDKKFDDPYDYTLDLSSGEWTDVAKGQTKILEIPEGLKPHAPVLDAAAKQDMSVGGVIKF